MKLVNKHIERDGSGYVTLRPEDDEDMWHVYNLISEGDEVRAQAVRRVQTTSSTGSTESNRVRLMLTIKVKKVSGRRYEPYANLKSSNRSMIESIPRLSYR